MALQTLWFILWGLLWAVYFMLDGFDFGAGICKNPARFQEPFQRILAQGDGVNSYDLASFQKNRESHGAVFSGG